MQTPVGFESSSAAKYPTDDGRSVCFGDEIVIGTLEVRFEHRSETDEMPTDVVACDFRVPDAEGRIWKTTSRCTTEVFMRHVNDFSATEGYCFDIDRAPETFAAAITNHRALDNARFSSDDRFYRRLLIGGRVVDTKFYYTTVNFDVGIIPDEDARCPILVKLAVQVRKDCLVHILNEDGDTGAIGGFGFFMDWRYLLLSNTAVYSPSYARWVDMALPMPLVFSATGETGDAQPDVVVR